LFEVEPCAGGLDSSTAAVESVVCLEELPKVGQCHLLCGGGVAPGVDLGQPLFRRRRATFRSGLLLDSRWSRPRCPYWTHQILPRRNIRPSPRSRFIVPGQLERPLKTSKSGAEQDNNRTTRAGGGRCGKAMC
jgi:hypothetical protein